MFYAVANAGVLIVCGRTKLLVDALFTGGRGAGFSPPSDAVLECMLAGEAPFDGLSAYVFTHLHPDHGEPCAIARIRDKSVPVLLPRTARFAREVEALENPVVYFDGAESCVDVGGLRVTAVETEHAGGEAFGIEHRSLFLGAPGRRVFLAGDARSDDARLPGGRTADIAFLAFPEVARAGGRALIEALSPKKLFLYHLPFPEDDRYRMNAMTRRRIEENADWLPETEVFRKASGHLVISGNYE
jgi:L-ascorbate metabolism protein UlaG (beta-lactamase superfamily)